MSQMQKSVSASQRNYGIDLLRLVAAFYVIVLHTLNHGGVYYATQYHSSQDFLCRILLIFSFCAVNIFAVISGYVGYREPLKKISYSGYLQLWLTVVFYCVLSAGIYSCVHPGSVSRSMLLSYFLPVTSDLYWYFSAYTLLYFLAPFLNKILYHSSDKELKLLFVLICFVFVPIEYINQPFAMEDGYSAIWLLLLYLVGGIMKKTGIGSKIPAVAAAILIVAINFGFFALSLQTSALTVFLYEFDLDVCHSYVSPIYLSSAILHVILFCRLRIPRIGEKIIRFAAPAAFSVYIVNKSPLFWKNYLQGRFSSWAGSSPAGILVRTLLFSFSFVCAVVIIDYFRRKLFHWLGVQNWVNKLFTFLHKEKNTTL